jgi:hypothetical protein
MGQYYLTKHSEPQYPLYTLPANIITEEVSRLEKTYLKKMLIIGVLAAVAIAIGYPVAVWALTIAKPSSSIAINTNTKESGDSEHEAISIEEINIEGHEKALGNNIIIYGERGHREESNHPKSRTILSAVINITVINQQVQGLSPGNKVGIVLTKIPTKNGGDYSLLIRIHTQDRTYHIVTNNTKVNIGSDTITINGIIARSTHAEFKPGQQITLDLRIGSAILSSDSLTINGDVLALIFKR